MGSDWPQTKWNFRYDEESNKAGKYFLIRADGMAPSLIRRGAFPVKSTTVEGRRPLVAPPSTIRSTKPSNNSLAFFGWEMAISPEILALVAVIGK